VFEKETGGYLDPTYILKYAIHPAMVKAGVRWRSGTTR
jgi:hypothetical protein